MRDYQRGAALDHAAKGIAHPEFGFRVYARSSFVKNKNLRLMRQRTREGDELFLAGGKRRAPFPDLFIESIGQGADKVAKVYVLGGLFDMPVFDPLRAQSNVAGNRPGEQEALLQDDSESAAQVH